MGKKTELDSLGKDLKRRGWTLLSTKHMTETAASKSAHRLFQRQLRCEGYVDFKVVKQGDRFRVMKKRIY